MGGEMGGEMVAKHSKKKRGVNAPETISKS